MFLVETEFLFGLVPGDPWNEIVEEALGSMKDAGVDVRCLASGILEVVFVAKSEGKKEPEIRSSIVAMLSKMRANGINTVESIDFKDILGCLSLRELYAVTFYDALHASSTLNRSAILISNDDVYDKISGLKRVSIKDFVKMLRA